VREASVPRIWHARERQILPVTWVLEVTRPIWSYSPYVVVAVPETTETSRPRPFDAAVS
jgi:hypothetical protein